MLAMTAVRAGVIYVFLLVMLRLLGKRTIGNSTAFDFMVAPAWPRTRAPFAASGTTSAAG